MISMHSGSLWTGSGEPVDGLTSKTWHCQSSSGCPALHVSIVSCALVPRVVSNSFFKMHFLPLNRQLGGQACVPDRHNGHSMHREKHRCLYCRVVHTIANGTAAVVQWKLKTGRTHQIRVHAQHIGCPLFGDSSYGGVHHAVSKMARGVPARCDPPISRWTFPNA